MAALVCVAGGVAEAATVFADSGSFEAAAGAPTLLDDYNDIPGAFTTYSDTLARPGYDLTPLGGVIFTFSQGISPLGDGTHLGFGFGVDDITASARFDLDTPISGFAFDVNAADEQAHEIVAGAESA
ncbi:MAG: hypothetical protein AAGB05_13765 [Pseudomonadota bacterium]